ncbi:MAG: hypothetical protein MJ102_02800 [Clostridia bacterium]|nr:hypothetical protein [Clostridia bacterium]
MKKILSILIAILMLCSLGSCTFDTNPSETKQIGNSTENETTPTETKPSDPIKKDITITEQVCFEHDGIKVTAKSITNDSIWGTGIKLLVENNSDKDYSVSSHAVIVNNCMVSSLFSCQVAAGKKANETLYLSSSSLEAAGITNIGQIEVYFYVYDSSSYTTVYEAECTTIKTSLYDTMDTKVNDTGYELYNKDGIRIVGKYVDESTIWGSSVLLFIENNTDQNITVSCNDMSINGFMVTSLLSSTVYKGKYTIDDITILSSSLEENDIKSIDTIELKFHIFNSDTYKTIVDTDVIKFNAK